MKTLEDGPRGLIKHSTNLYDRRKEIEQAIDRLGAKQYDKRLNRWVKYCTGAVINISGEDLDAIKSEIYLDKYTKDWERMKPTFNRAVGTAKKDPDSRQIFIQNDENFYEVFPCFTSFQFVRQEDGDFGLTVYQRSSDLAKLIDDLMFFGSVVWEFENETKVRVDHLSVIFGHIHYEIKEE